MLFFTCLDVLYDTSKPVVHVFNKLVISTFVGDDVVFAGGIGGDGSREPPELFSGWG